MLTYSPDHLQNEITSSLGHDLPSVKISCNFFARDYTQIDGMTDKPTSSPNLRIGGGHN